MNLVSLFWTIVVPLVLVVVDAERRISPLPWEKDRSDSIFTNTTSSWKSNPSTSSQSVRKEYYRFIPSDKHSISRRDPPSDIIEDETSHTLERNLGYDSRPLLPTKELRFNKFKYVSDEYAKYYADFKPLISKDYPIYGYVNKTLRIATNVHSVITPDDYEVKYDIQSLLDAVGGYPAMPDDNEDNVFWKYLGLVIHVQYIRLNDDGRRKVLPRADLWADFNLDQVAYAVYNEYPGFHPSNLIYRMVQGDYGTVEIDNTIIFKRCNVQFLHRDFMLADVNTWALNFVAPHNFALKWFIGRPRPEEVVWAIKTNVISYGVPDAIKSAIRSFPMKKAEDFTAYPDGCPNHPSFPAMHGANGGTTLWMAVVLNLNDIQLCQVLLTDYAVGFARVVAGVHFPDETIVGLNVAQEVLARALPEYLAYKYGSDPYVVRKKIKKVRYDWRTFDPKDPCPWLSKYSWYQDKYIGGSDIIDNVFSYGYFNKWDRYDLPSDP